MELQMRCLQEHQTQQRLQKNALRLVNQVKVKYYNHHYQHHNQYHQCSLLLSCAGITGASKAANSSNEGPAAA
jgi:hypothetical protein